jgi:Zn-dependent metalloprotease
MISAVCALVLMLHPLSSLVASGPLRGGSPNGNPFSVKERRHVPASHAARQAFEQDLTRLSERIAHLRGVGSPVLRPSSVFSRPGVLRLQELNGGPVDIVWDESGRLPVFIKGVRLQSRDMSMFAKATTAGLELQAMSFLQEHAGLLQVERPEEEFVPIATVFDAHGMAHVRYQQVFEGIEVWGRDVWVHLTADGNVESFNGRYLPTPRHLSGRVAAVSDAAALATALSRFPGVPTESSARRVIHLDDRETARLCWLVQVRGRLDQNWHYVVDAASGEIVKEYNHIAHDGPAVGSGLDLTNQTRTLNVYQVGTQYLLIDASKPMFKPAQSSIPQDGKGVIYTLDAKNADSLLYFVTSSTPTAWPNKQSVSAAFNGSKVYDYYKAVHSRDAIDGNGSTMNLVVNFSKNYNNAFWNGQLMVFGNGDGVNFGDLAGALDVTAHEMTHGVIERSANLIYENQPGALNESFADVFGVLFEFWADPSSANWSLGETVTTPGVAGDALRRMDDPGASNIAFSGQQPAHMNDYRNLPNTPQGDNGGVHINSGIPNKAFYLFATSPGVTLTEAGQVYYRALTLYLNRNSQFIDCRLAVIKAAEDLFGGPGNAKAVAAAAAFDAVGITAGSATPPPPSQPPVQGNNFLAVVEASTGNLYRTSPTGTDITLISSASLYSRPTVTDDGSWIFYVDNSTNLRAVQTDGSNDQAISTGGGFNNVAISPDGRYLAATSIFEEARIYVFDLQNSSATKVLPLSTPTYTQGVTTGNILYADRLDWTSDGQVVMYDAFNITVNASGDTTGYWDINMVRVADTAIARLFPPQPPGVSIGNAVFASNSDNTIAFDYFEEGDSVRVLAVNLNTGQAGLVTNNYFSLGSPSFSNDDRKVFFHYLTQSSAEVYVVDLASDGITGLGNEQALINGGYFPVSFTVGSRPTDVSPAEPVLPASFRLQQNFPNPFNPTTVICYDLPQEGRVSLKVFDLLGREVADLVRGRQAAGSHSISFDASGLPSGVYVARMQTDTFTSSIRMVLAR